MTSVPLRNASMDSGEMRHVDKHWVQLGTLGLRNSKRETRQLQNPSPNAHNFIRNRGHILHDWSSGSFRWLAVQVMITVANVTEPPNRNNPPL